MGRNVRGVMIETYTWHVVACKQLGDRSYKLC